MNSSSTEFVKSFADQLKQDDIDFDKLRDLLVTEGQQSQLTSATPEQVAEFIETQSAFANVPAQRGYEGTLLDAWVNDFDIWGSGQKPSLAERVDLDRQFVSRNLDKQKFAKEVAQNSFFELDQLDDEGLAALILKSKIENGLSLDEAYDIIALQGRAQQADIFCDT